jgi:hypothetical protein
LNWTNIAPAKNLSSILPRLEAEYFEHISKKTLRLSSRVWRYVWAFLSGVESFQMGDTTHHRPHAACITAIESMTGAH